MGNYHVRFRGRGRGSSHREPSPLPDGVEDFEEITIRHSKYAASRFAYQVAPALTRFANSSPCPSSTAFEQRESYDRWTYMPEKRAATKKWDAHLRRLLSRKTSKHAA